MVNVHYSESGAVKLTKQQRRDRNRKLKDLQLKVEISNKEKKSIKVIEDKVSVYKRIPKYPILATYSKSNEVNDRFVNPSDKIFSSLVTTSYDGFVKEPPSAFPLEFHQKFESTLLTLEEKGYFQYDYTQPAGLNTKIARTSVTRCLVGIPGITYKYLGLRMFAYPWTSELNSSNELVKIGQLNSKLIEHSNKLLKRSKKTEYGSCDYNLTLINRCFPINQCSMLKDEPLFKQEKCAVSWHADSSLNHYSTIAVYHFTHPHDEKQPITKAALHRNDDDEGWRIALRVHINAEGPQSGKTPKDSTLQTANNSIPPIAVPLPSQWSYYLLDDFNHHHQHAVLASNTHRYASTHRVSRKDGHSYEWIRNRCTIVFQQKLGGSNKLIRSEQLTLNELEFEWIRQFYIQGKVHYDLHTWWHKPMQEMLEMWSKLELRTKSIVNRLKEASSYIERDTRQTIKKTQQHLARITNIDEATYQQMIELLTERYEKREGWVQREQDPIFLNVHESYRPLMVPWSWSSINWYAENKETESTNENANDYYNEMNSKNQQNLLKLINDIRNWKDKFVSKPS